MRPLEICVIYILWSVAPRFEVTAGNILYLWRYGFAFLGAMGGYKRSGLLGSWIFLSCPTSLTFLPAYDVRLR
jgi:hypothetical protein